MLNKYYRVEIIQCPAIGIVTTNSFVEYAKAKPTNTTEHLPMKDIHKAYFDNAIDAEDYRQKCIKELFPKDWIIK